MRKLLYILTFVSMVLSGCKKDKGNNNLPVEIELDSFPLNVGCFWKYYTEIHLADSNGVVYHSDYYDNYWTVISDTTINGVPSAKISQSDSNYNGNVRLAYSYYANKPDGFFGMAVENAGSMFYLKTNSGIADWLNPNLQFSNLAGVDSVVVPDSSPWFFKFPTALNDTWHAVKYSPSDSFYQIRKYDSYQTVTTDAGTFNCIRVKIYFENNGQPLSNPTIIYQYLSEKGLIEETHLAKTVSGNGETVTISRTTKLVQVNF